MSPVTRMYFPVAPDQVATMLAQGRLEPGLMAFAVDDAIRASAPEADEEFWEFRALQRAAAYARAHGGPIVVAAADVPDAVEISEHGQALGALSVNAELRRGDLASFHLGDDALSGQSRRGEQPQDDEQIDLSWFDTTELAQVVRLLSPPEETATWTQ